MEKNNADSNMVFFVSGESKKKMNIIFNKELLTSHNLIFDSTRIGLRKNLIGIGHPKVYLCNRSKIVDIKEVTYLNADSVFKYVEDFVKK